MKKERIYVTFENKRSLKKSISRTIDHTKFIKKSNCGEFRQLYF